MGLDIRFPIGLMFVVKAVILIAYGFMSDPAIYQRSLGMNINLVWGGCMLAFGLVMLFLGRKGMPVVEED